MTGRAFSLGIGTTAALAVGIGFAAPASAQSQLTIDASLGAGIASNPFLETGDTPATGSVTAQISPAYFIDMGLTRFQLRGDAALTKYFQRYRNSDSYSLSAEGSHQISGRTSLTARLGYNNSVVGALNDRGVIGSGIIIPGLTTALPVTPVDESATILPDVTPPTLGISSDLTTDPSLGGIGSRRRSYTAGAGFSTGLGPRDRIDLGLSVVASRAARSSGSALDDFNYVTQQVGYRRAIRPGLDITADLSVGRVDYLRQRANDATTIQPTVGAGYRLADGMQFNLAVGVTVVRTNLLTAGATRTSTSFFAQGSLCQSDSRYNTCVSVSRSAVPSSAQGVRVQTAVSLTAGVRLSARSSLSASTSYSRSGGTLGYIPVPSLYSSRTEYVTAHGSYDRQLSQRLAGFVTAGVARAYGDIGGSRDASYEVRAGLRIRLGAIR